MARIHAFHIMPPRAYLFAKIDFYPVCFKRLTNTNLAQLLILRFQVSTIKFSAYYLANLNNNCIL